MTSFLKDPDAINDYTFDWDQGYLDTGETISSSNWSFTPGSTSFAIDVSSNTALTATAKCSGGAHRDVFYLTNRIVTGTTAGATRTEDRTVTIRIWEPRI